MKNKSTEGDKRLETLIRKIKVALILKNDLDLLCSIRFRNNNSTILKRTFIRSFKDDIIELDDNSLIYINDLIDLTYLC